MAPIRVNLARTKDLVETDGMVLGSSFFQLKELWPFFTVLFVNLEAYQKIGVTLLTEGALQLRLSIISDIFVLALDIIVDPTSVLKYL